MIVSQTIFVNVGGLSNKKLTGSQCSNWGSLSLYSINMILSKMVGRIIQEVTQEYCECEMADVSVVVSKPRPRKASNGVDDKTNPTISIAFDRINFSQKLLLIAKRGSML
ncbi:MAG: hypothetical protein ACI9VT_001079 [Psychroserpens sp.]|jgi:hypothetical protein